MELGTGDAIKGRKDKKQDELRGGDDSGTFDRRPHAARFSCELRAPRFGDGLESYAALAVLCDRAHESRRVVYTIVGPRTTRLTWGGCGFFSARFCSSEIAGALVDGIAQQIPPGELWSTGSEDPGQHVGQHVVVDVQEGDLAALLAEREHHRLAQLGRLHQVVEVGTVQDAERVLAVRIVGEFARVQISKRPAVADVLPDQAVADHHLEHVVRHHQPAQLFISASCYL
uniref:Uncharacterized protein n=1 Tax=Anopheles atroparvus TaxID=41427 RepID=A0A182JJ86_ANOAO